MSKKFINLFFFVFIINKHLSQMNKNEIILDNNLRSLKPTLILNSSTKYAASLKFHTKLLQTVYSESYSKNYYYTTLYVGPKKVKQTYVLDTGSSIMSSPCSPCQNCGHHKSNYHINFFPGKHKPLKCDNKPCKLVPATNCMNKKDKNKYKNSCSFDIKQDNGDGMNGYYLNDIVYFEVDNNITSPLQRLMYRSYALPIGCTTGEYGKYKELNADGIIGLNNNEKSFISLLYNLKIINKNIFSLCFGLGGGYMSLGEIDTTYHKVDTINYVPLLNSDNSYLIKIGNISVGDNNNTIRCNSEAIIDTGNKISYFPDILYKSLIKDFQEYCSKQEGKCGEFQFESELGFCASFEDRESLFKSVYEYWPNITLHLVNQKEYIWKPIHYYYYYLNNEQRKACLGFSNKTQNIILGANFIQGHDIIFDRANKRLGFVFADCSRGNLLWNRMRGVFRNNHPLFDDDPKLIDKKMHESEKEGKFHFGDNTTKDMLDFVQGHNTELNFSSDFQVVNFILLLSSILIVLVIFIIVVSALLCRNREYSKFDYSNDEFEEVNK